MVATSVITSAATKSSAYMEVTPLGSEDWRVCDARIHPADATRVLAYVQRDGEYVEVLWMHAKRDLQRFSSLDDAFDAISRALGSAHAA